MPAMSTPGSNGQLAGDGPPATQPAPPRAPERRPPSVFEPGASGGDIGSVFGTTRRVAGANLPDHLGPGPRPEPDAASLRRPADSVRSDLGALQRGLSGEQGERRPRGDD